MAQNSGEAWDYIAPYGTEARIRSLEDVDRTWARSVDDPTAYYIGKIIGDVGAIIGGLIAAVKGIEQAGAGVETSVSGVVTSGTGVGALVVPAGVVVTAGGIAVASGGVCLAAAGSKNAVNDLKKLVDERNKGDSETGNWNKGSFDSPENSLNYHYRKHGDEVGATSRDQYLRKAEEFAKTAKKGSSKSQVDGAVEGTIRYKKNGKYIDIAPDGSIVSFGKQ